MEKRKGFKYQRAALKETVLIAFMQIGTTSIFMECIVTDFMENIIGQEIEMDVFYKGR